MRQHVDVVKNEWLAGYQFVVAQLVLEDGQLSVESPDPSKWEPIVLRPVTDPESGDLVYAEKTPEEFVHLLANQLHGTHLFATEPHNEDVCPFRQPLAPIQWGATPDRMPA